MCYRRVFAPDALVWLFALVTSLQSFLGVACPCVQMARRSAIAVAEQGGKPKACCLRIDVKGSRAAAVAKEQHQPYLHQVVRFAKPASCIGLSTPCCCEPDQECPTVPQGPLQGRTEDDLDESPQSLAAKGLGLCEVDSWPRAVHHRAFDSFHSALEHCVVLSRLVL
jgi:hypothetical protein